MRALSLGVLVLLFLLPACGRTDDPVPAIEHARETGSVELIELARRGGPDSRARALLAMGRIQSSSYVEPIVEAVLAEEPAVRRAAWFALGQLGLAQGAEPAKAAVEIAVSALSSEDVEVVALATEALGKLADPSTTERLVVLLDHDDARVRTEAAHALLRMRFVPTWRGEADEPPPLPAEAVEALAVALDDPSPEVREAAAHALSRYGEPAAVDALAAVREDPGPWVRMFAVRGVGRAGDAEAATSIAWGLVDPDLHVRRETVTSLAALGRPDLVPAALDADPSFHVRAAVAAALAEATGDASLARLRVLEGDASPTVRAAALGALSARLGAGYLDPLVRHLTDVRWTTRVAAVRAAGTLGEPALDVVLRAAEDTDPRVRTAAMEALETFRERAEVGAIVVAALESDDLAERATAADLVAGSERADRMERLSEVYDRSAGVAWVELREVLVDAVAEIAEAEPLLRRAAADDPAPSVRIKAREALEAAGFELPESSATDRIEPFDMIREFDADPVIVLETSKGAIEITCYPDDAPVHVANFVGLVEEGFYDGLIWHRVAPNFVVQGGDPLGSGWGGPGYVLPDEINRRRYTRGTVGMPKAGKDTGGCQLFVTHVPTPHLDGNYTVFGQVTSGLDVIDLLEIGDTIERAHVRN